jgi:ketosteroid isomerase-like protein
LYPLSTFNFFVKGQNEFMKQARLLQVLVMVGLYGSWVLAQDDVVTVDAMRDLEQQWSDLYESGTSLEIANLYAEDAAWDAIGEELIEGRQAIRLLFSEPTNQRGENPLEITDAASFGDWGYTSGIWTDIPLDGEPTTGHYVNIFKMVDGEIKFHRQIFKR